MQVFQNGALIRVAVKIKRIERNDRGQKSCARTRHSAADEVALSDHGTADAPVNRRTDLSEFEIEFGRVQGCFRRPHRGLDRRVGLRFRVVILLRNGLGRD